MAVVYAAFDHEKNTTVALKLLDRVDGDALLRFKREFRAVQDLAHPNVVALEDLVESDGAWFFTMELVDGVDFVKYVRAEASAAESSDGAAELDEARLRSALGQLALGLDAFHRTGQLHRDLKPSNVLVTGAGRVVLLDFGLSTRMEMNESSQQHGVGTAAYMAPEQAVGLPLDTSADWYAFGALLYEALTGRLPFSGTIIEMLMDKQQTSAATASSSKRRTRRSRRAVRGAVGDRSEAAAFGSVGAEAARRIQRHVAIGGQQQPATHAGDAIRRSRTGAGAAASRVRAISRPATRRDRARRIRPRQERAGARIHVTVETPGG